MQRQEDMTAESERRTVLVRRLEAVDADYGKNPDRRPQAEQDRGRFGRERAVPH